MDPELVDITAQVYSDLGYLEALGPLVTEYLVGEVSRNIVNDSLGSSNLDIIERLSRDLENENVLLSNQKITTIVLALRCFIKVYYRVFTKLAASNPDPTAELHERLTYQLSMRTSLRSETVQALLASTKAII